MSDKEKITILPCVGLRNISKAKKEIKKALPLLDAKSIRRYKIPYHEAVLLELEEEGSYGAAEYFKFIFNLDEESRRIAGPNTAIWTKPKLKDNYELIDYLRAILTEFFQLSISASTRATSLIETALVIENLTWDWWWIANTLYRTAFCTIKEIEDDNEQMKMITTLRFIYGRFLFNKMKDPKGALEHARKAHRDSRGKPWNASKILNIKQESLFRESCALVHKVLLNIARDTYKQDPQIAVNSCKIALATAIESGHEKLVAEAQFELGKSSMSSKSFREAMMFFTKCLKLVEAIPDPIGVCDTLAELANVYKEMGEDKQALEYLKKCKSTATNCQLPYKLAEAHHLTGEYYLFRDDPEKATPNFETAFSLYNSLDAKETNRSRCLAGISRGQEMLEAYRALIVQSLEGSYLATLQILYWRDRGEPFDQKLILEKSLLRGRTMTHFFPAVSLELARRGEIDRNVNAHEDLEDLFLSHSYSLLFLSSLIRHRMMRASKSPLLD